MTTANQAFFDKTITLLHQQGRGAFDVARQACRYKDQNGAKCAIGVHIPDDLYVPEMEGKSVRTLLATFPALRPIFEGVDVALMNALQIAHDGATESDLYDGKDFWVAFSYKARGAAAHFDLSTDALDALEAP